MTKVHPQVITAQLEYTLNTLDSEVKLLTLYVTNFRTKLASNQRREAGKDMMGAKLVAQRMGSMLKDIVRYTAFLHASTKNSPGVQKGTT